MTEPKLLSGGNPQIAKRYGDATIQAWIAAAPGWKGDVARRLDALIERTVPGVKKAVKWNTPLYGIEDDPFDEVKLADWLKQASSPPGERM